MEDRALNEVAEDERAESVPLQVIEGCLVAPIQVDLTERVLDTLQHDVLVRLQSPGVHGVVFDVSGLTILDAFEFTRLRKIGSMASIMGVTPAIVGLNAGIVAALVDSRVEIDGILTESNLAEALRQLALGEDETEPAKEDQELAVRNPDGQRLTIRSAEDLTLAIFEVKKLSESIGFSAVGSAAVITSLSELAQNILKYAGEGLITICPFSRSGKLGLQICAEDFGPGIADTEQALRDHHSTGGSLGLGLPGVRRLMDEFEIESEVGRGTSVRATKWRT